MHPTLPARVARMRQRTLCLGAILAVSACSRARTYDLIALWESRDPATTDTLYTTYYNDRNLALHNGFADHGVAAWLPCALATERGPNAEPAYQGTSEYPDVPPGDTTVPSRYAHGYPTRMDFPCRQPTGAVALYRMHKASPQTDHVYVSQVTEFNALQAAGYAFERVEGYIFTAQVPGSTPLYRLVLTAGPPGGDVEHRYTISASARQGLENGGWSSEGIAGYVFASYINPTIGSTGYTGTFNGHRVSPTSTVVTAIRDVTSPRNTLIIGGDSDRQQHGLLASNVTARPPGAVWQNASFHLYTGNIFSAASTLDHIPLFLHYASAATTHQLSVLPPYDGIALVLSKEGLNGHHCGAPATGGQLSIEIGEAFGISCASNLATPMQDDTWYAISYSLNDAAMVRLSISDFASGQPLTFIDGTTVFKKSFANLFSCPFAPAFGALAPDQSYCGNPYKPYGFPVGNTGYMMYPLFAGAPNLSARISETKLQWLDSNFDVLH